MQTIASRSEDVVRRFFDAYLHLRDLDKTLECLADDIRWIGTGDFERAGKGFCDCRELLIEEFKATPGSFDVKLRNLYSVEAGKACYTDGDMSVVDPSSGKGVNVRISAMCGEVPDGRCLIQGIHASLPSGEQPDGEFFPTSFLGEGNELSSQSRRSAFQLLKNSIPGGLIGGYIEKGFPLYFINDQLLGYLGYSSYEDFVEDTGGMVENGIHPGDRDRVNTLVNESMTVTDSYEVSYRMLRRDGSYIWVLDRGLRNISEDGRPVIVSIVVDITRSHELQEQLQQSVVSLKEKNAELEACHAVVFNGFAKLAADAEYTILEANDQFFCMIGYTREEVRGQFGNRAINFVYAEDLIVGNDEIRNRKATGRFSIPFRVRRKDGSDIWVRLDACRAEERWNGHEVLYCFYTDIDEQQRREADYRRQRYFMSLIDSSLEGGFFVTDGGDERRLAYISEGMLHFLGYEPDVFQGLMAGGLEAIVCSDDVALFRTAWREAVNGCYEQEYRIRKGDGQVIWVLEKGRRVVDGEGEPVCICLLLDITERKMRQDELIRQTRLDPLTGLYNREYAQQFIQTYLDIHRGGHSSALLVFDLDHFKRVNDRYGHLRGDAVLIAFAKLLQESFRTRDFVARTGGDEFIAFMQDVPSRTEALDVSRRIREAMSATLGNEYADCKLSVSIGVAYSHEQISYDALFQLADDDMYRMKFRARGGRELDELPVYDSEGEHSCLFRYAYGLVLRIDLDTGLYTVPYGEFLARKKIPSQGDYEAMLKEAVRSNIVAEDSEDVYALCRIENLRQVFESDKRELLCEYRAKMSAGGTRWIQSRFFFATSGRSRLCYSTITDITETRHERERSRVALLYDFALSEESGEIYECNLTRNTFRIIRHSSGTFLPLPDEGRLDDLKAMVRESMIHPEDLERYDRVVANARSLRLNDGVLKEDFRCLWRDNSYHWVTVNVLCVEDADKLHFVWVHGIDDRKRLDEFSRENAELQRLHMMDERYRIIVEQTKSVVFDWGPEQQLHYAPYLGSLLDCRNNPGNVPDMLRSLTVHPRDMADFKAFHASLYREDQVETTVRLRRRDGAFIWCRIAATLKRDAQGKLLRIVGTISDMDDNVRALRHLRYQAEHDPVTGYSNFAKFKTDAAELLAARGDRKYSLWYCDIRNFKFINDIYGYDIGDELLSYWAELIAEGARPGETFGRISGDNFALLRCYRDIDDLVARFLRCSDLLTRFEGLANRRFRVEMIAGIYLVERPEDILSIDDMLDRANLAQKSVKHLSGSKYALYSEEMRKRVLYEKNIESCMEEALRNREFCLHLQPQVDIQHGDALFGAEVLVRWERPGYGMVSPGDFIPLFERNGFIVDLDAFVFEEACAYLASRGSRGLPPLRLSVNVSRLSIAQGDFLDRYSAIRDKYGIDSGMLELECTETMVIRNFALFRELMAALPSRGFRSAMDDFGTGYSSLNMLKEIALDVLKLDIAFFRDTEGTPRERAVVESIVQMARALGMSTVAEGVEKQEQVEFLRSIGCSAIQGYIFSRPVPLTLFESVEASFPLYVEG